jgi:hypothetical protein
MVDTATETLLRALTSPAVLTSRIRTAILTIVLIAVGEMIAMRILVLVGPTGYWPSTLIDATAMVGLVVPLLWFLAFGPLFQSIAARRKAELRLGKQARDMEELASQNDLLLRAEQRERRRADTLHAASLAISHTLDLEEVFKAILVQLARIVPYDRAKIILCEGDSQLRVRAIFLAGGTLDFPDRPFDSFPPGGERGGR